MIKTTKETFKKDQENLIVNRRNGGGYNVSNLRTLKMYVVIRTDGKVTCTCPDHIHRNRTCKHMIAVKEAYLAQQEARAIQKANQERTRLLVETIRGNGGDAGYWERQMLAA